MQGLGVTVNYGELSATLLDHVAGVIKLIPEVADRLGSLHPRALGAARLGFSWGVLSDQMLATIKTFIRSAGVCAIHDQRNTAGLCSCSEILKKLRGAP